MASDSLQEEDTFRHSLSGSGMPHEYIFSAGRHLRGTVRHVTWWGLTVPAVACLLRIHRDRATVRAPGYLLGACPSGSLAGRRARWVRTSRRAGRRALTSPCPVTAPPPARGRPIKDVVQGADLCGHSGPQPRRVESEFPQGILDVTPLGRKSLAGCGLKSAQLPCRMHQAVELITDDPAAEYAQLTLQLEPAITG